MPNRKNTCPACSKETRRTTTANTNDTTSFYVCYDCYDDIMRLAAIDAGVIAAAQKHAEACNEMRERVRAIAQSWASDYGLAVEGLRPAYDGCHGASHTENTPMFRKLNVVERLAQTDGTG